MKAILLLGSNMGNRLAYLKFSCFHVQKDIGKIEHKSEVYETDAWGNQSDKPYLNQVIVIQTDLKPLSLLAAILLIERKAGRERKVKWGNRTLDIDILFIEDLIINQASLIVPHPEIANRKFVLVPMMDIDPDFVHPSLAKTTKELLLSCPDHLTVKKHHYKRV